MSMNDSARAGEIGAEFPTIPHPMKLHVFDIETIPQSDRRLSAIEPQHEAPANLKDPEKIRAAVAEKAAKWKQRAALDATTGRVAMIGVGNIVAPDGTYMLDATILHISGGWDDDADLDEREADIIGRWWNIADRIIASGSLIAGFNCHRFDLPFLIQRSWILKVPVSANIDVLCRYFRAPWLDLMQIWAGVGNFVSLDTVSKSLGLPGKNGDPTQLATLLRHDIQSAIAYLQNDLALTYAVANRMGLDRARATQSAATPATDY